MKNLIKKILKESKSQKIIDYVKSKNFSNIKDILVFLIELGFDLEEIKETVQSSYPTFGDFTEDIPTIVLITDVIDNWGTTIKIKKKKDLIELLTSPDDWTDDQIIWGKNGYSYFWDDLVNEFVIVGNQLLYIEE